jgi:N-acetylmuramoyl-L-alanine amidase
MTVDLANTTLSAELTGLNQEVKRLGVERLQVVEFPNNSLVRVTLDFSNNQQQWNANVSESGGLLLWPDGGVAPEVAQASGFATIESIQLINNGTELVIKSDRPLSYDGAWDRATLDYAINIFSAQIAEGVSLPSGFEVNNPILSIQERTDEPETVTLLVQPNPNFNITGIVQQGPNQIALQLQPKAGVSTNQRPIRVPPRPTTPAPPTHYPAVSNPSVRDGRMVIIIDPGHGGRDPGAVGLGGLRETDVVLDISHQVTQLLEQNGVQVVMTRQDDREVDLAPRTQLANRVNADLFISIHANAVGGGRTGVNGLETYYYQSGNLLAQYIQNSMLQSFNMNNRGVKQARFYVLRHTRMPAALVEVGFVTGSYDSQILADPTQRTRMAEAIARGILQYIQRTRR